MNAKEIKFLELFEELTKIDVVLDKLAFSKKIRQFVDLDFSYAVDIWEYYSSVKENEFTKNDKLSEAIGFELFNLLYVKNQAKTVKAIADSSSIRRSVYQYSEMAGSENSFTVLLDFAVATKVDRVDDILKALAKNTKVQFGKIMKTLLERLFVELLKKNPTKLVVNRKLSDLLLSFVRKIKTDEKAMLEQRLKEIK